MWCVPFKIAWFHIFILFTSCFLITLYSTCLPLTCLAMHAFWSILWVLASDLPPIWNYSSLFQFPQPVSLAHPARAWQHAGAFLIAFDCLMNWFVCMHECGCNLPLHIGLPSDARQLTINPQHQIRAGKMWWEMTIGCKREENRVCGHVQVSGVKKIS